MKATISPSLLSGTVKAPPSKSMAHRLLIGAGLSEGTSIIRGVALSEDIKATLKCLTALGVTWQKNGDDIIINGVDVRLSVPQSELECGESGSTMRFFVPISLLSGNKTVLTGAKRLLERPLTVYADMCREKNMFFSQSDTGVSVKGPLVGGEYNIPGNISSQFISGLLFALPLLKEDSVINILPPVESRPYINLTIRALSVFGIRIEEPAQNTLFIPGGQHYIPTEATVEGDWSNAAFFEALNLFGNSVKVTGLDENTLQGDRVFVKHFESLSKGSPVIHIGDCPDLAPILFAVSAAKYGGVFTGTRRLKLKESDRAECMATELRKFGTAVTVHEDDVVVFPKEFHAPTEILDGHNDHRIVMSLAVLCTLTGGEIDGAEAVNKSYPGFFDELKAINCNFNLG